MYAKKDCTRCNDSIAAAGGQRLAGCIKPVCKEEEVVVVVVVVVVVGSKESRRRRRRE